MCGRREIDTAQNEPHVRRGPVPIGRLWVGMDASNVAIETSLRRLGVAVREVRSTRSPQD
jgi:hypothetical protein